MVTLQPPVKKASYHFHFNSSMHRADSLPQFFKIFCPFFHIPFLTLSVSITLCFSLSLFVVCDEDQFGLSLYNPQNMVINGSNYTIGVPQFCVTGTISRICNDGTNHPGVAQQVCTALGFACKHYSYSD